MNIDLLRQRRNLIAVSSALLLFDFAKVTITKVSIMGTELLIGDARVLIYSAWAIWAYFLLRYYQYLKAEGDLRIVADFKSQFSGRANQYVFKKINRQSIAGTIDFKWKEFRWHYTLNEYDPTTSTVKTTDTGALPQIRAFGWALRSISYIAVQTPKATDHVLPILLAIAAPMVSLVNTV